MIFHPISWWHNTWMCSHHILHCPYAINWFWSSKKGGTNFLSCKVPYHLRHIQTIILWKEFSKRLFVDDFICVKTNHKKAVPFPSLLQLRYQIVMKIFLGQVKSFFCITQYCLCCWYVVLLFNLPLPQGLEPHTALVRTCSVITNQRPRLVSSLPLFLWSNCSVGGPKRRRLVPPCWVWPIFSWTLCETMGCTAASPPLKK